MIWYKQWCRVPCVQHACKTMEFLTAEHGHAAIPTSQCLCVAMRVIAGEQGWWQWQLAVLRLQHGGVGRVATGARAHTI